MMYKPFSQPSLMTAPQLPMGEQAPRRQSRNIWAVAVGAAAILIVVLLLIYTGGMDAILKLLGVGASRIYEISLTNTNDWLNSGSSLRLIGNADMDGTNVFSKFSSVPEDIDLTEKGIGLVTSIFSSPGDPNAEIYQTHQYTSPAVDLEYTTPYLSTIEAVDFNPTSHQLINYYYRSAASVAGLSSKEFSPLEPAVIKQESSGVNIKSAVVDQPVSRYIQIQFDLSGNVSAQRSAVYSASFQYKESGEATSRLDVNINPSVREYLIGVAYSPVNLPNSVDVDVLSDAKVNSLVYSAESVYLTGRVSYSFQVGLLPGVYALVISGSTIENKVMPFEAGDSQVIKLDVGSLTSSTGMLTGDLNGDGVVNVADLIILQQRKNLE